eukprot:267399_1
MGCEHSNDMYNINTYDLNAISQEETATEEIQEDDQTDDEEIANNCLKIIETNDGYYNVVINPIQIVTSFLECFAKNDENGGVMKQNLLMTNIQHELLVFGYIRTNAIYNIPNVLIRLCVAYFILPHYTIYKPNNHYLFESHHANSLHYAKTRNCAPPKTLQCYWIMPPQHEHGLVINWIEPSDYKKVTG